MSLIAGHMLCLMGSFVGEHPAPCFASQLDMHSMIMEELPSGACMPATAAAQHRSLVLTTGLCCRPLLRVQMQRTLRCAASRGTSWRNSCSAMAQWSLALLCTLSGKSQLDLCRLPTQPVACSV